MTVTSKGEVLLNYDYAYDGNGNCTKKSGERFQNEYAYDRMNRLTEAAYNGAWERYAYDVAGNRLRKGTEKEQEFYAYNKKNQLFRLEKGAEVTDYRYDIQGNLLEETGTSGKRYVYDALNRLNSVTTDTAAQKNHYDGESLRYETEENGKVIRFAFDRGKLSAEEAAGGSIRYIHGSNDVVCSEREETEPGFHIRDEAGSTLFILDREQNIRKAYRYDAFGGVLEERGDIENRLTYTGQMYDGAMGQYYLRARFYNPAIGRFLQEDVYRGDGLNLYAYCANNPVMYYDPSGYLGLCPGGKTNPGKGKGGSGTEKYGIDVENIEFSNTVQNHTGRPYQDSKLLINEIIDSKPPVADPRGTGALSWTVDGTFNGSKGYYELIIDPNSNTVWHFVFKSY